MKVKAVIFDLDGTLLDSMYIWDTIAEDYLSSVGVKAKPGLSDAVNTLMMEDAAEYLKSEYTLPFTSEEIFDGINKIVEDFYFNKVKLKDGVIEFLELLAEKNIRMCVATASERYVAAAALKRLGIIHYFDRLFICSEVGHSKTEPNIFNEALDFLNKKQDEVLVFEDALFAASTAKKAGFRVCGVFDRSEKESEKLKQTVDFYINTFKEAGDYID